MMGTGTPDLPVSQFISLLWQETGGDLSKQCSMYDIGSKLGLDRQESSRTAESLMTDGTIEVRTLSGGVGFTPEGAATMMADSPNQTSEPSIRLGQNPVLQPPQRETVETICAEIRHRFPDLGLSLEQAEDLIADLKTMNAQLYSPHPKTAVFRECLSGMERILGPADATGIRKRVQAFLS